MSKIQDIAYRALTQMLPGEEILVDHRPEWLCGLEMDFYLPNLCIAIEIQGDQHYYVVPKFHNCVEDFQRQQNRDAAKKEIINRHGINLIVIDQALNHQVGGLVEKMRMYISPKRRLGKVGKKTIKAWDNHVRELRKSKFVVQFEFVNGALVANDKVSLAWLKANPDYCRRTPKTVQQPYSGDNAGSGAQGRLEPCCIEAHSTPERDAQSPSLTGLGSRGVERQSTLRSSPARFLGNSQDRAETNAPYAKHIRRAKAMLTTGRASEQLKVSVLPQGL